jgi:hypothetical protein
MYFNRKMIKRINNRTDVKSRDNAAAGHPGCSVFVFTWISLEGGRPTRTISSSANYGKKLLYIHTRVGRLSQRRSCFRSGTWHCVTGWLVPCLGRTDSLLRLIRFKRVSMQKYCTDILADNVRHYRLIIIMVSELCAKYHTHTHTHVIRL